MRPIRRVVHGVLAVAVCIPLLLTLAGCPGDATTASAAAPGRVAPAITAPSPEAVAAQQAQEQQVQHQIAANQQAEKVQQLINRAEASYANPASTTTTPTVSTPRTVDFDFAVDTLLSSGMDLKNDPQLSDEFEHLLSAINSLEMVALKRGNGFSPPLEAAPLDIAGEVTFPSNPALVGKVTEEAAHDAVGFPAGGQRLCRWLHQLLHQLAGGTRAPQAVARTRRQVQGHDLQNPARQAAFRRTLIPTRQSPSPASSPRP